MSTKFNGRRLDKIFREVKETIPLEETILLTPSTVYGVIPQSELPSRPHQVARDNYNVHPAQPGDFVISMSSFMHGFEYCGMAGGISPDYTLLRPNFNQNIGRFLKFSLKSDLLVQQLGTFRTGIRQGQRLQWNKIRYVKIPIPEENLAKEVADFLDQKITSIDKLIAKKQTLFQSYFLKIAALIHEVLSDPNTKYLRFGYVAKKINRLVSIVDTENYIPIGLYNRGRGIFHKDATLGADLGESIFSWIKNEDLIFSGQFAWEGAVALAGKKEDGKIASHRYPIYKAVRGIKTAYLFAYFRTHRGNFIMEDCSRGSAGRNRPLNTNRLEKELIPIPSLTIQANIEKLIKNESNLKRKIVKSIFLLKELRKSLITSAVTGELDIKKYKLNNFSQYSAKTEKQLEKEAKIHDQR